MLPCSYGLKYGLLVYSIALFSQILSYVCLARYFKNPFVLLRMFGYCVVLLIGKTANFICSIFL